MLRLLIIEDHALVREGLALTVKQLAETVDVMEAGSAEAGIKLIAEYPGLDLVLLDLALPGSNGLSCLQIIRQKFPMIPVVVVSAYDDMQTVHRAIDIGALGFIPKAHDIGELLTALRQVLNGRVYVPERLIPAKVNGIFSVQKTKTNGTGPEKLGLTERQVEVLRLMTEGRSNREIAEILSVCEGTVKTHVTAVFRALQVSSRTQALLAVDRRRLKL